ncbi:N-acetylmuramoyl-L-alanine amidase [Pseudomonas sp. B21-017]|uniref:N-acetylmuramoyl-L-alanine amidase n=1 Tax=Pseudomonas sp. B21-017 TaxID=2895474 RepID=UPI00215F366B|nr:N-acetylmuramoyl-L-alanine amidase [Pseudomonas sp. B21-017]UVM36377.1 N-acetylmuramoyl-L-alanine amidase [Pseudomonas sp. B21-017]
MTYANDWNVLVPEANCLMTPNKNSRKPAVATPTHIVIHVTGTNSLPAVKKTFLTENSVSAHYLITKEGEIYQFAPDAFRAWHAGIDSNTRRLYNQGTEKWIKYLKYFNWYKNYPNDAIYVDGDLNPVWDKTEAAFVARADAQAWSEYDYFRARWPGLDVPINFAVDPDPNNYSIGIETLGFGAKSADADVYTDAMYKTLEQLVADLSDKYAIPLEKGWIIGHEDVNPIGRFGWDPAPGFDWSIVYKS